MYLSNLTRPVPVIGVKVAQSTYGLSSERGVLLLVSRPIFPYYLSWLSCPWSAPLWHRWDPDPFPLCSAHLWDKSLNIQWPQRTHLSFSKSLGVANSVFIPFTENKKHATRIGTIWRSYPYSQGSWNSPGCCQWLLSGWPAWRRRKSLLLNCCQAFLNSKKDVINSKDAFIMILFHCILTYFVCDILYTLLLSWYFVCQSLLAARDLFCHTLLLSVQLFGQIFRGLWHLGRDFLISCLIDNVTLSILSVIVLLNFSRSFLADSSVLAEPLNVFSNFPEFE